MSVHEAVATRILMRVIRVAAAWLKRWRRGGEGGRRRCRAEVETMAARQGGAYGGLNGGGGCGDAVSAGSNGRVGGTAAAATRGRPTATRAANAHALVGGLRRAAR